MMSQHLPHRLPGTVADWRGVMADHYLRLGPASRRLRFLAAADDPACLKIARQAQPGSVLAIEEDGRVVGIVEIFPQPGGRAEIGLSVEDGFQGRGFGRKLLLAGLAEASRLGCEVADFVFDPRNSGLRSLVAAAGGKLTMRGGDGLAEIGLRPVAENAAA